MCQVHFRVELHAVAQLVEDTHAEVVQHTAHHGLGLGQRAVTLWRQERVRWEEEGRGGVV
jgi:hypothetical protein